MFEKLITKLTDRRTFMGVLTWRVAAVAGAIVGIRQLAHAGGGCPNCGISVAGCCLCHEPDPDCQYWCAPNCIVWCWQSSQSPFYCYECACNPPEGEPPASDPEYCTESPEEFMCPWCANVNCSFVWC
jgi:hypothetical protein